MSLEDKKIYEELLRNWKAPERLSEEEAWNSLQSRLAEAPKQKVVSLRPWVWLTSGAAAVVLLMLWLSTSGTVAVSHQTAAGISEILLPDGSKAYLNAGSSLSWDAEAWDDERLVQLEGEAFFDVIKGSTFTVTTPVGEVKVLGTTFDVYSRAEDFRVQCFTGKVNVRAGDSSTDLTPGECTHIENGRLIETHKAHAVGGQWWLGSFLWEDAPLDEVFDEIERHYGVEIDRPDLSMRRYSGGFEKSEIDEVLELVCLPMGLSFEHLSGTRIRVVAN